MDLKRRNNWFNIKCCFHIYGCLMCVLFFFGHVLCTTEFSLHWSKCSNNEYFLAIRDISLEQCKTECYMRSECQGANYRRVRRTCELFSVDRAGSLIPEITCVYINRKSVAQVSQIIVDIIYGVPKGSEVLFLH